MAAQLPAGYPLLLVIDPLARATDGESVRIAKDVLCAGASSVKIALPDSAEEVEHVLAHRGRRRPVVLGDDDTLLQVVRALHRERALGEAPLAVVPIGPRSTLARALGVPGQVLTAARAVLDGAERELDLLLDDSGGIVLGELSIPCAATRSSSATHWWAPVERTARSLVRGLTAPLPAGGDRVAHRDGLTGGPEHCDCHAHHGSGPGPNHGMRRLRVEADGIVLADLDRPVYEVSVRTCAPGLAEVSVRHPEGAEPVRVRASTVTVSGRDFRYHADTAVTGPVRVRTWTVRPAAWRLTVPR